jgi:putative Holliday junction resolvase
MGFDFGTQSIGVAVGQEITCTATALKPLPANNGKPNWDDLEKVVLEWQPSQFVVGMPYNMDGTDSELCRRAARFGGRLQGRFGITWVGVDERLSSFEVKSTLKESGIKKKGPIDSLAAQVILETWFRSRQ